MTHVRLLTVVAVALGAATAAFLLPSPLRGPTPLPFDHVVHTRSGMACAVCHAGVATAASARLPKADVCTRCHAGPPPRVQAAAWRAVSADEPPDWGRLTRVPDHVMFSHRRHVALARLECVSCHGDIGRTAVRAARLPVRLDMNACLSCHTREGASTDCAACHR